ncbi:SIS domain-containing protein [Granulicoccus phenolivorans]|uniref:SIS domain-containing protein n=1 Tax=Granulicoccus phenolivorans TaxID=266854 RepID=UPI0004066879|nr:SIS domain-containing protein [Granulicoccus phenolivorans]
MSESGFDDSRLEDRERLTRAEPMLRHLAGAGARLRTAAERSAETIAALGVERPRAVIAVGSEARLIRAVLEPTCPVPFVAWPAPGLPGWVGALDVVVVLAPEGGTPDLVVTVREAVRRGAHVLLACPENSMIVDYTASRSTTLLPTGSADPMAAALVMLEALARVGLGPEVTAQHVAETVDLISEDCSPYRDLSVNPAKELAVALADAEPLVWGGSVLAARAARRVAEGLRQATGRPALAADADALLPLIEAAERRDLFADPFEDGPQDRRPVLIVLDDGNGGDLVRVARNRLVNTADQHEVRVCPISHTDGDELERYAYLLHSGLFAVAYLGIGLGRTGFLPGFPDS